jgi:hypothetical protein
LPKNGSSQGQNLALTVLFPQIRSTAGGRVEYAAGLQKEFLLDINQKSVGPYGSAYRQESGVAEWRLAGVGGWRANPLGFGGWRYATWQRRMISPATFREAKFGESQPGLIARSAACVSGLEFRVQG